MEGNMLEIYDLELSDSYIWVNTVGQTFFFKSENHKIRGLLENPIDNLRIRLVNDIEKINVISFHYIVTFKR